MRLKKFCKHKAENGLMLLIMLLVLGVAYSCKSVKAPNQHADTQANHSPQVVRQIIYHIPQINLPYTDSTNLNNMRVGQLLTLEQINALQLQKIYPYDLDVVEKIWINHALNLSPQFQSYIIQFQPNEHELFSTLVTYTKQYKLIDFEYVAYDEIAENCQRIYANIEASGIQTYEENYCLESQDINLYYWTKAGELKKDGVVVFDNK